MSESSYDIYEINQLLAQKSEQYVQERLEHEATKHATAATIARLEAENARLNAEIAELREYAALAPAGDAG